MNRGKKMLPVAGPLQIYGLFPAHSGCSRVPITDDGHPGSCRYELEGAIDKRRCDENSRAQSTIDTPPTYPFAIWRLPPESVTGALPESFPSVLTKSPNRHCDGHREKEQSRLEP